jgi:UDP-GlcNAc:undecaprenyl-phosphate GlcNAc-1-phosphate transferase
VDRPGGRRHHEVDVPRGGGLAIGGSFLVVSVSLLAVLGWSPFRADNLDAVLLVTGLLSAGLLALVLGWLDDIRDLSPAAQLAAQIAVTFVAVYHRLWLQRFVNPLTGQPVDLRTGIGVAVVVGITVFWYLGFMNTLNWLDGIDGLAASVSAIAAVLFAVHMIRAFDQWSLALLPMALAGACLGFLPWNARRARVFMGSSGSMFLGVTLAALALIAPAKVATAVLVMAVPIVDVAWQILYRLRSGKAPWIADRGHLHHRLYDRGWSPHHVVALYAGFSGVLGTVAVAVPESLPHRGLVKLSALALVAVLTAGGLWRLARDDAAAAR